MLPPWIRRSRAAWIAGLCCVHAFASDATIAGAASSPYPTITNLSLEWLVDDDDNRNGVVQVRFRAAGDTEWRQGLPLLRVPAGQNMDTRPPRAWANKHSGSIFDLRPDTEYEVELTLADPDGGSTERVLRVRTRPVPGPARDSRLRRATPATIRSVAADALPGDIVTLEAGDYGELTVERDGTGNRPIVFRSAKPGAARFTGVSLRSRRHVQVEGLHVDGTVDLLGGEDLAVRRCVVHADYGIVAKQTPGVRNSYIADNVVRGRMPWDSIHMGHLAADGKPANVGEGIEITGPGNVICHNDVQGFRDAISLMEDQYAGEQVSIDIYNNDIRLALDDGIEADFCGGNCRVMRNRLTNCFVGLSSQPGLGGPTYFVRNVMYNLITMPFKLGRFSLGDVLLHNTAIKVGDACIAGGGRWSHAIFRNNLCIGGRGGGVFGWNYSTGPGRAFDLPGPAADADYDGAGVVGTAFAGRINGAAFEGLDELRERTTEKHGVLVNMDVFEQAVPYPDPPIPSRQAADLRLRSGSAAVDAGVRLSNVNDGFAGKAPDLGAYEAGSDLPLYGPRPMGVDEAHPRTPAGRKAR
jgi:hypothetical protein